MLYIVSYDIVEDTPRTKLAKNLCDYGHRVQYSVFECELTTEQYKKMKKMALKFIDKKKDNLKIYHICQTCAGKVETFGFANPLEGNDDDAIII